MTIFPYDQCEDWEKDSIYFCWEINVALCYKCISAGTSIALKDGVHIEHPLFIWHVKRESRV